MSSAFSALLSRDFGLILWFYLFVDPTLVIGYRPRLLFCQRLRSWPSSRLNNPSKPSCPCTCPTDASHVIGISSFVCLSNFTELNNCSPLLHQPRSRVHSRCEAGCPELLISPVGEGFILRREARHSRLQAADF